MKTYWTVKTPVTTLYFKSYRNAKEQSFKDYHDKPIRHVVNEYTFNELVNIGAFVD